MQTTQCRKRPSLVKEGIPQMMVADVFAWLIIGALAGWVINRMINGTGLGLLSDILIGIVEALIGGFVKLVFIPARLATQDPV